MNGVTFSVFLRLLGLLWKVPTMARQGNARILVAASSIVAAARSPLPTCLPGEHSCSPARTDDESAATASSEETTVSGSGRSLSRSRSPRRGHQREQGRLLSLSSWSLGSDVDSDSYVKELYVALRAIRGACHQIAVFARDLEREPSCVHLQEIAMATRTLQQMLTEFEESTTLNLDNESVDLSIDGIMTVRDLIGETRFINGGTPTPAASGVS